MFPRTRRFSTLPRSLTLLRSFGFEQTDPEKFYRPLAEDTAELLDVLLLDARGTDLTDQSVLDVGGGPGYFASAFAARGARYVPVEPDVGEMAAAGIRVPGSVRGDGQALPFRSNAFDVVYSSNVAEHVPAPWTMAAEMLRVARPGGLVVLSYTVWLGPFGGHETGLWEHYVGGEFARRRYEKRRGHRPALGPRRVRSRGGGTAAGVSPLSPVVGVVAGAGAGAARVPRLQPGRGAAQAVNRVDRWSTCRSAGREIRAS